MTYNTPVFICSFYRPPNTNTIPIVLLHETLRILQQSLSSPNIIIGGDFNLPSVIWSDAGASIAPSPAYGREINDLFLDLINDVSLEQLVFQPTRQRNILDLVLSSHPDTISNVEVVPGMSDHEIIVFDINLYASTSCTKATYSVYLYHRGNLDGIRQDMLNFKDVFMSSTPHHNSVEVNWTSLKEALLKSVSKHIPMKKYKNSHRNLPWINRSIKSHMKKRKKLYNTAKQLNTEEAWVNYRKSRNEVNNMLKAAHEEYRSRILDTSFSGHKRQFWKYIRTMKKNTSSIPTLISNGFILTNAKDKATVLNSYFQSVFTIEDLTNVPNKGTSSCSIMEPIVFTVPGVQSLLESLEVTKSPGPDKIHPLVLKHCASELAPVLQVIFSQSLSTGNIPSDWLISNITPVHKKGDRDLPSNYRPISLTSICSKTIEHVFYRFIMNHLKNNQVLSDSQHGFRAGFSCTTQLVSLIDDVSYNMDARRQVDMILLDFSKAFDTVPHHRLLQKLKYYCIDNQIIKWITKWLTSRKQRVLLDGESSDYVPVTSGVPQGTVLGPLLFLIYINDIIENITSKLKLFADDCLLYRTITSEQDTMALQKDLDTLVQWASKWQMKFNTSKCTIMRCTRSANPIQFKYTLQETNLEESDKYMYLGVMLDKSLSWSSHITHVANKATRMLNFIKRHLSKCSTAIKASAYSLLVRPLMEYACAVWDPHYLTHIAMLEKIQRRAARWTVSNYNYLSSVSTMLHNLNWPTLSQRRRHHRLNLFYQTIYNLTGLSLPEYYQPTSCYTRHHHLLHLIIPPFNTTAHMSSFFPNTIRDWNQLPVSIIELKNYNDFLSALTNYVYHN